MGFGTYNGILRKIGRKAVLPAGKIKQKLIENIFSTTEIDMCVDFGAGTLFWSEWLKLYCKEIYAIDIIYEKSEECVNGIHCMKNMDDINWELWGG